MWLRENIDKVPVADRLILNMINYAARDIEKPLAPLSADFENVLNSFGY